MKEKYWDKARAFHGHECPGLAIGVRACMAAAEKMNLSPAFDEEIICITETDACGVDAIQALMSCTLGKGNLIYKNRGKQAFTFIERESGQAMRFYLKGRNEGMEREQYLNWLLDAPLDQVFSVQEVEKELPEKARIFLSLTCEKCGEIAAENRMRLEEGKKLCLDCYRGYERGW